MNKILFVDHVYHKKTKSSDFFKEILSSLGSVTSLYIDPSDPDDAYAKLIDLKLNNIDSVVLWQLDYLGPYFLSYKKPTLIVPMFDASGALCNIHWKAMRDALFVSFSLELHYRLLTLGNKSIFVKYFPNVIAPGAKDNSTNEPKRSPLARSKPSVFFWERLPQSSLNVQTVCDIFGEGISHLHVHQCPDVGVPSAIPCDLPLKVTRSSWFKSKSDFFNILSDFDFFIAPRFVEGIGFSFLEAMAIGKIVIATNQTTHNEYIRNFDNGILFEPDSKMEINLSELNVSDLRASVERDSRRLLSNWESNYFPMLRNEITQFFLESKPISAANCISISFSHSNLLIGLLKAHNDWGGYYAVLESLLNRSDLDYTKGVAIMPRVKLLIDGGKYLEAAELVRSMMRKYGEDSPYTGLFKHLSQFYLNK